MSTSLEILKSAPQFGDGNTNGIRIHVDHIRQNGKRANSNTYPYFTPMKDIGSLRTRKSRGNKVDAAHSLFSRLEEVKEIKLVAMIDTLIRYDLFETFDFDRYIARILNAGYIESLLVPILGTRGVSADRYCMILHYACNYAPNKKVMTDLLKLLLLENRRTLQPKDQLVAAIKKLPMAEVRIMLKFMALNWRTNFNSVHWLDCIVAAVGTKMLTDAASLKFLAQIRSSMNEAMLLTKKQMLLLGPYEPIAGHRELPQAHSDFRYRIYCIPDDSEFYYNDDRSLRSEVAPGAVTNKNARRDGKLQAVNEIRTNLGAKTQSASNRHNRQKGNGESRGRQRNTVKNRAQVKEGYLEGDVHTNSQRSSSVERRASNINGHMDDQARSHSKQSKSPKKSKLDR